MLQSGLMETVTAGVIGYGPVGRATAEVMRRLGHKVVVSDTEPGRLEEAYSRGHHYFEKDSKVDILFVCVPETKVPDILLSVPHGAITVIRSTVLPGTTDELSERFGCPLVHMPEFLREATALRDVLNPRFILIGSHSQEDSRYLAGVFAPLLVPIIMVAPSTSEMVKLVLNAYLHTLVSFWNEVHLLSNSAGLNSYVIGKLCGQDPRISSYGATVHGQPVGGRCLPKDLAHLIAFAEGKGYTPELLEAVQKMNDKLVDAGLPQPQKEPLEWQQFQVMQ